MTAQSPERLKYDGEDLAMCSEPLNAYFALSGNESPFFGMESDLWRGYSGSWEIKNDRLYLIGLRGTLGNGEQGSLATLFPETPDRVFAHWFSGTIQAWREEMLRYEHSGYNSVYEEDLFFEFDQGVLKEAKVRQNGKVDRAHKAEVDRVNSMSSGAGQPWVQHMIVRESDGKFLAPLALYPSRTYVSDKWDAWIFLSFDMAAKVCVEGDRIVLAKPTPPKGPPTPEPTLWQRVRFRSWFALHRLRTNRVRLWSRQGCRLDLFVHSIDALYDDLAPRLGVTVDDWVAYVTGARLLPLSVARRICQQWPDVALRWIYLGIGTPPARRRRSSDRRFKLTSVPARRSSTVT